MNKKRIIKITLITVLGVLLVGTLAGGLLVFAAPIATSILPKELAEEIEEFKGYLGLSSEPDNTNSDTTSTTDYITESEAKTVAFIHSNISESDVAHVSIQFDKDDGIAEYDIEFWHNSIEYDYEINAITGDIISFDHDHEHYNDNSESNSSQNGDYIGEDRAKEIALQDAGVSESDTSFLKCEFEYDDGRAEYEIEWEIGNMEYDYTIDAIDGAILEKGTDLDD